MNVSLYLYLFFTVQHVGLIIQPLFIFQGVEALTDKMGTVMDGSTFSRSLLFPGRNRTLSCTRHENRGQL